MNRTHDLSVARHSRYTSTTLLLVFALSNHLASGASVVAIDNKIEQAMDLVKSHLMYAVREEVEVLKEQIKELFERNSMLEQENAVLKSLANSDQLSELSVRPAATNSSCSTPPQQGVAWPPQPRAVLLCLFGFPSVNAIIA
uniref:TSC22 domain family, member 2 n=1 Tax=Hucho hucho TaxID=62062 RepID=A0A4W5QM25_9TELE